VAEGAPNLTPPPGNPRFPLFDSLRAIAALCVFLGHTVTGTYSYAQHPTLFVCAAQLADQGVAIFFLISGFLLYRPFLTARRSGRTVRLRDFYRRRVLRIVPAYWVALTVFIALGFVSGITSGNWWLFYGFGQIYSLNTIPHGIGVAWTLCIEITFYAVLPAFAFAAARLGRGRGSMRVDIALLLALSAASLVFRAHFNAFSDYATVSTLAGYFPWFALGMGLAIASVSEANRRQSSPVIRAVSDHPTLLWAAAAVGSVLLYELYTATHSIATSLATHLLYALVALCILLPGVFGETAGGLPRRVLRLRALGWIGLISYSFYLYHTIVIAQLAKGIRAGNLPHSYVFVLVVSFLLSCAVAAVSYYVVERPMMRLRSMPWRGRARTSTY
jgi:peptidoglycan/LPS O-acetylase OafA/YrhL